MEEALTIDDIEAFGLGPPPQLSNGLESSQVHTSTQSGAANANHPSTRNFETSTADEDPSSTLAADTLTSPAAKYLSPNYPAHVDTHEETLGRTKETADGSSLASDAAACSLGEVGASTPFSNMHLLAPSAEDLDPAIRAHSADGPRASTPDRALRVLEGGPVTGNAAIDSMLREALRSYAENAAMAVAGAASDNPRKANPE
jgi:hypothetical protein